jgi:tetratricopeptide (TPR) repeat protein
MVQILDIKWNKPTFQTRLISWQAAAKDFPDHPILGTGHGNYAVIFDKHFTPNFFDFTRGETYFDRAHNNVVDIAATAGILGLVTYLSIFGAVAYYLIRGFRRGRISLHDFIILTGLLIAYFIQNLAVFDALVTYMSLMMTLAYIYWLDQEEEERGAAKDRKLENPEIYALMGAGLLLFVIMYQYNIKPLQMLVATIDGQRAWAQGQVKETVDIYRQALSYNTVLDRDSRTSLNRLFAGNPDVLNGLDKKIGQEILDFNIELAETNVKYNESDSLNQMLLAQVLNTAASYNRDDPVKFAHYTERALKAIEDSIKASPGRVPIYFQKAQVYITRGEQDKAIETLKYAYDMYPPYYDSACYLGRTYLFYQNEAEGYAYIDKCIDLGGRSLLSPVSYVKVLINHYVTAADWPRAIALYERLLELEPNEVDNWIKAAKLFAENGLKDKAVQAANKAVEINPGYKPYADEFINSLQ